MTPDNISTPKTHFHIYWTEKNILDWQPFETNREAWEQAQKLAGPGELFRIEQLISTHCPVCAERINLTSPPHNID